MTALTGCYAAPFFLPPLRVQTGAGYATGHIEAPLRRTADSPIEVQTRPREALTEVRASINPLQLIAPDHRPPFDLGLGYSLSLFLPDGYFPYAYHGPYLELGFFPWAWRLDPAGTRARFALNAAAGLAMYDAGGGLQGGESVRVSGVFEVAPFANEHGGGTTRHQAGVWGVRGEYNISLELAFGYQHVGASDFFTGTLGLVLRLPATAGAAAGSLLDFNSVE